MLIKGHKKFKFVKLQTHTRVKCLCMFNLITQFVTYHKYNITFYLRKGSYFKISLVSSGNELMTNYCVPLGTEGPRYPCSSRFRL